jgi:hypothetical protein
MENDVEIKLLCGQSSGAYGPFELPERRVYAL